MDKIRLDINKNNPTKPKKKFIISLKSITEILSKWIQGRLEPKTNFKKKKLQRNKKEKKKTFSASDSSSASIFIYKSRFF